MVQIGYALSSEEHRPGDLVRYAAAAEASGFPFALISDHFHPRTDARGQSPFVWSVLGGIAGATERLRIGTGVTCPTVRIHPAVIAHARAVETAHRQWVNAAMAGELGQELPLPAHFEQAGKSVRPEDVAEVVVCGPDPERHIAEIRTYADAGFDHIYVHQVGPDQDGFFRFYAAEVLPE